MTTDHTYQTRVQTWLLACFNSDIAADMVERNDRFIEEALELVQATGYSAERAHALVDYVFGRPVGEVAQEVGGVCVTLSALCSTAGVDLPKAAEAELDRIEQPAVMAKIRAKQAAKPTGSALPIAAPEAPWAGWGARKAPSPEERQAVALERIADLLTQAPDKAWDVGHAMGLGFRQGQS